MDGCMTISSASDCWTQVHRLEAYLWHFISSDSSTMDIIKKNYLRNVKYIKSSVKLNIYVAILLSRYILKNNCLSLICLDKLLICCWI